tara:strand:+ start:404 stop:718 length:315 start_codon:yes stop_codon:yes gene_type:complete
VFDLLWRKISTLRRGEKRSILNKLWDGEISKRFVLMNALMMNSLYLAKIFWRTSSKRFGTFNSLISAKKKKSKKMSTNTKGRTKRTGVPLLSFFIASLILALKV